MQTLLLTVLIILLCVNTAVFCSPHVGNVFPLPLTTTNDDPAFPQCPVESGAYPHTTNCSLFHMCTFHMHAIYTCIDGFFFNPSSGKCQYWPVGNELDCTDVVPQMLEIDVVPLDDSTTEVDLDGRRKSATSACSKTGIYPDILDCSVFHYCRSDQQHDVFQCPNGLNFDPKTFMCSATQLVDCQYEPPETEKMDTDSTSTREYDALCENYPPGTRLPVTDEYDEFIVCEEDGQMVVEKCPPGLMYHALKMTCVKESCTKNFTLCKNQGQCMDDPSEAEGFRCICLDEYDGKYCETRTISKETSAKQLQTSTRNLLQLVDLLTDSKVSVNSTSSAVPLVNLQQQAVSYTKTETAVRILLVKNVSTTKSFSSSLFDRFSTSKDNPPKQVEHLMKLIYVALLIFIASVLLASMAFFLIICARLHPFSSPKTVSQWITLVDECKV